MKSKYTLRYLPVAVDDLMSIFDWIAEDSPTNAATFIEKLDHHTLKLEANPLLGRIPRDEKRNGFYLLD